ncbi:MAG: single-stranded DNA-binding protein [Lachnospiraceae bacterium]|nr:single-stranded DNA-binding protein [Lachnospiraceae bacterium]
MNKTILIGRLTRDPEIRYTDSGTAVARFSLAVDRRFHRGEEPTADFFHCTAFGKQAEFCENYLRQGVRMIVIGRLQNNNYTGHDGQKVYGVQVIVDELEFAESRAAAEGRAASGDGFLNVPEEFDEELPFN